MWIGSKVLQSRYPQTPNPQFIVGFPEDNIQVFEIYNSIGQTLARTHPRLLDTQKFLLSLWHTSSPDQIRLDAPISYYDRLRIRQPGDAKFALGPHVDGGSVERWEDPGFRKVFGNILKGGPHWKNHDPFDATPRIDVKSDLYNVSYVVFFLKIHPSHLNQKRMFDFPSMARLDGTIIHWT